MSANSTGVTASHTSDELTTFAMGLTYPENSFDDIFQCAVVTIGVVGLLANGFVILVTVCQMKRKLVENVLILNQLVLDLVSCCLLTVTYSIKLCHIQLIGWTGYWLCLLFVGETCMWVGISGSIFNLGAIAIERYIKICHSLWHKAHFRTWIAYLAVAVVWVCSCVIPFATSVPTTKFMSGLCLPTYYWSSETAKKAYGVWYFLSFYVILIIIFSLCYGRIFAVLKHQQKIFTGSAALVIGALGGEDPQQKQAQMKLLRTTFMLALSFAICWLPNQLCYILVNLYPDGLSYVVIFVWYVSLFVGFFSICTNPFIYGAKSVLVKNYISKIMSDCMLFNSTPNGLSELSEQRQQHSSVNMPTNTLKTSVHRF